MFERLLPGSQLVNRMQDKGFRVTTVSAPDQLIDACRRDKPILLIADVPERSEGVCAALTLLQQTPDTNHLPIIAVVPSESPNVEAQARKTGAKLVVQDSVILAHLDQFVEQALQLD